MRGLEMVRRGDSTPVAAIIQGAEKGTSQCNFKEEIK